MDVGVGFVEGKTKESAAALQLKSTKLDVGCGAHCMEGAIGIDQFAAPGVAYVHDVNQAPWPLPDNAFQFIRCQHAIEHFSKVHVVAHEMWRVAQHGALIEFITPHYSSYASWGDPTHVHHFALGSIPLLFEQALGHGRYEVVSSRLKFTGSVPDFFAWLIYKVSPKAYEKHFAWIFPANEIHITVRMLKAVKQ